MCKIHGLLLMQVHLKLHWHERVLAKQNTRWLTDNLSISSNFLTMKTRKRMFESTTIRQDPRMTPNELVKHVVTCVGMYLDP